MPKRFGRSFAAICCALALTIAVSTTAAAQTTPPGAAAPVPVLPSGPPPPFTVIAALFGFVPALADIPVIAVRFDYFGRSSAIFMLTIPVLMVLNFPVGVFSGPNATDEEAGESVEFGRRPAGSEVILFFIRGTRGYVFDTFAANYAWIDLSPPTTAGVVAEE